MFRSKLAASVFSLGILFLASCDTESCDREEPRIRFEDYDYSIVQLDDGILIDSLIVKIWFEDCQGDIGVKEDEEGFNLETHQYELLDTVWMEVEPFDSNATSAFFAKVPYSDETNEGNRLEGTIEQRFGSVKQRSDTVRFEVRLLDRAGNVSNTITTPTFYLQDY